jgi:hypothetical protein
MTGPIRLRTRSPVWFLVSTLNIAVLVTVALSAAKWLSTPSRPTRGSCRDVSQRLATQAKMPIQKSLTRNIAGQALLRIRASRPDLSVLDAADGTPDARALLRWASTVPDSSAMALAGCARATAALAKELSVPLPSDGLPLLSSLLGWMERRTPAATEPTHMESNRNLMLAIHRIARDRFVPEWQAENGSVPTADEVMHWARTRPAEDRSYEELWSLLLRLELDPAA